MKSHNSRLFVLVKTHNQIGQYVICIFFCNKSFCIFKSMHKTIYYEIKKASRILFPGNLSSSLYLKQITLSAASVLNRCHAVFLFKEAIEVLYILVSCCLCDLLNLHVAISKQSAGLIKADPLNVLSKSHT